MDAYEIEKDEQEFEDMLNELYGTVEICGMTFDQGRALRELDPVAFRCALVDEPVTWGCDNCNDEYDTKAEAEACCKEE